MSIGQEPPPEPVRRVLIVEDELLIGMLLEDMLNDLGYVVAATAARLEEALQLAGDLHVDAAILDVNVNGEPVFPVAEALAARGIPFVFASGYGESSLPAVYQDRPALQKPFQQDALKEKLSLLFK